jgi:hypothetical protein
MDMTVYIVQRPTKRVGSKFVDLFDVSPAEEYGELVDLLPSSENPFESPNDTVDSLWVGLENYDGRVDHILCIGNPILIGWTIAVASNISPGSVISCLQWNTEKKLYFPVVVDTL